MSLPHTFTLFDRYEEKSLGIFEALPDDEDDEPALMEGRGTRRERIGLCIHHYCDTHLTEASLPAKYLGWHLRRQTAHGEVLPLTSAIRVVLIGFC